MINSRIDMILCSLYSFFQWNEKTSKKCDSINNKIIHYYSSRVSFRFVSPEFSNSRSFINRDPVLPNTSFRFVSSVTGIGHH